MCNIANAWDVVEGTVLQRSGDEGVLLLGGGGDGGGCVKGRAWIEEWGRHWWLDDEDVAFMVLLGETDIGSFSIYLQILMTSRRKQ